MNVNEPIRGQSDESRFFAALAKAGIPVSSVAAIRDQYDPLPSGLAALLLEWIPRLEDRRLQESVAWALLAAVPNVMMGRRQIHSIVRGGTMPKADHSSNELTPATEFEPVYQRISGILAEARSRVWQAVNSAMVAAYWEIGRTIVEEEQRGDSRAAYGTSLLAQLSRRLTDEFGKGFDRTNLQQMRNFYLAYPNCDALRHELSWTHYRLLLRVENADARGFYEAETVNARWSTRELDRQINSLLFERLALSRDKAGVLALAQQGHEIQQASDLIKDPYVLEFTGLPQSERLLESDLEQALIDKLQQFLLELGKGFAFMGRQQRVTLDGQHFFIDLVFYNRLTRCFVLIDLKIGRLAHEDIGQMQMYVNYYQRELTSADENPPLGIILCTDKSEAVVRFTLPEGNTQIFASRYKLHLPTEEELAAELQRERRDVELRRNLNEHTDAPGNVS